MKENQHQRWQNPKEKEENPTQKEKPSRKHKDLSWQRVTTGIFLTMNRIVI